MGIRLIYGYDYNDSREKELLYEARFHKFKWRLIRGV